MNWQNLVYVMKCVLYLFRVDGAIEFLTRLVAFFLSSSM